MENNFYNRRGQSLVSIIIVSVIISLIIISGLYFYFSRQIPDTSEITKNTIQEKTTENIIQDEEKISDNKPSEQLQQQNANNEDYIYQKSELYEKIEIIDEQIKLFPDNPSINLIVDQKFYGELKYEINRLKSDIEKENKYNVKLYSRNWENPKEIRNVLKNDYNTNGLIGAIFIGDIPITYKRIKYAKNERVGIKESYYSGYGISENYYRILHEEPWIEGDEEGINTTYYEDYPERQPYPNLDFKKRIWTARLLPPGNDLALKVEMLQRYLNRNHEYREGNRSYNGFLFVDSLEDVYKYGSVESPFKKLAENIGMELELGDKSYGSYVYALNSDERKERILKEIQKNYEISLLSIHGNSNIQEVGNGSLITRDEIHPGSLFIDLASCSNGDISNENYLAGYYLFSGESLLVRANTVVTFYISNTFFKDNPEPYIDGVHRSLKRDYFPLAEGADFGTIFKRANMSGSQLLLGDPTLTLRNTSNLKTPKIAIKTVKIKDFSLSKAKEKYSEQQLKYLIDFGNIEIKNSDDNALRLAFGGYISLSHVYNANNFRIKYFEELDIDPYTTKNINLQFWYKNLGEINILPNETYYEEKIYKTNNPSIPYYIMRIEVNTIE
ncbi:MAG: hypothetical protein KJI69_01200 [Patescibacteria group bacterium]|nr:hypothetical protein [Patescibacteria group bacterium]